MKKIIYILTFCFVSNLVLAQTQSENYTKTTSYKVKTTNGITNSNTGTALVNNDKIEAITYIDGLGRTKQTIGIRAGGNSQDIITHAQYDNFGRMAKEFLPFAQANNNGAFFNNAQNTVNNFYNAKYPSDINSTSPNPFSEKSFETSPLNRILEQAAPGSDWAISNGHTIKFDYLTNTNEDFVRLFDVSFINNNTETPQLDDLGFFQPNQLYKIVTKDENWQPNQQHSNDHTTEEYRNKEGQVILKRTYDSGKWHDTYYVYDRFGNLTFVLPPKLETYGDFFQTDASSQSIWVNASGGGDLYQTTTAAPDGAYGNIYFNDYTNTMEFYAGAYTYYGNDMNVTFKTGKILDLNLGVNLDGLVLTGTMTGSHLGNSFSRNVSATVVGDELHFNPGFGSVIGTSYHFTLTANLNGINISHPDVTSTDIDALAYQYKYDHRNRLVEKKIPGKGWEYIIYNKLDQPIMTQDANQHNKSPKEWTFTKYDAFGRVAYTGLANNNSARAIIQNTVNGINEQYVTKSSSSTTIDGTTIYYNNGAYPTQYIADILTINYYDDYNFDLDGGNAEPAYGVTPITNANGLATGSKVRVLNTNDWITSVTYYDDKSRPIYLFSRNDYLSVTDKIKSNLTFDGTVIETNTRHSRSGFPAIVTIDSFEYDHMNRLISQKQSINGATQEVIVQNTYDDIGQLERKSVGGKVNQPRLQDVDYTYNVRGWLKTINDVIDMDQNNDLFSFGLSYNKPLQGLNEVYNEPLYNGNISHTSWKTNNTSSTLKYYAYRYDALNRFKYANYAENDLFNNKFNVSVNKYDRNGNIERLYRSMQNPSNTNFGTAIDNLTYTYDSGNKLLAVADSYGLSTNGVEGFKDGNTSGDDYTYDANGNMLRDYNKGISSNILYNHLNLPITVTINNNSGYGAISYIYDATGIKQRKTFSNPGGVVATTDYSGNYIYENNTLKFFSHPEGYIEPNNTGGFDYVYQYKDHLGNIRLSYKDINNDGVVNGETTTVFFDDFESASGWDSQGALSGSSVDAYDTTQKLDGNYAAKISTPNNGEKYVHSNTWIPINNATATEYVYSCWAYSNGPDIRIMLFMNEDTETSYFTMVDEVRSTVKNKWVYIEKKVSVPANIDKINTRLSSFYATSGDVWYDNVSIKKVNNVASEIVEENNYYPFGLQHKGYNNVIVGTENNHFTYNGKELEQELGLDWTDYGARRYMRDLGRWTTIDPAASEYVGISPYSYAANNPNVFTDPDGRRLFFVGGANNDQDGWEYITRWGNFMTDAGIRNFVRVNASNGKMGDVFFTNTFRNSGTTYRVNRYPRNPLGEELVRPSDIEEIPRQHSAIDRAVEQIQGNLADSPLEEGEQFNLAGYSYGSVLQAQVALRLANDGQYIDNLILIGSPISDKSKLFKQLQNNENIGNVIRVDIEGDLLSNPQDVWEFIKGGKQNSSDDGPHFDLARPGEEANSLIQTVIQWLQQQGVE